MKLKKWLSRTLVLAMVVALMIPVPVAAKGGSGKLVKSVTRYSYQEASGRWKAVSQSAYKYDKKNYPAEFEDTIYDGWFLGVPVSGDKKVTTAKYKYKGGSPKSAKFKDGAGKVYQIRKYKKGRVVSITNSSMTSDERTEMKDGTEVFKGDDVYANAGTTSVAYNKYGLATSMVSTDLDSNKYVSGSAYSESNATSYLFALTQKKGIPSMIIESSASNEAEAYTDSTDASNSYSYQKQTNADGTYTEIYNGETTSGKNGSVTKWYSTFDKNGLVVESGRISIDTATGAQKIFPTTRIVYSKKKGKVTQAIRYSLTTDSNGVVTKTTPSTLYKFKYAKAKADKVRYMSMVNSFIGAAAGYFAWF